MRTFKIPGRVQSKQRARFNVKNGRVYTMRQTVEYESYVKACYTDYMNQFGWKPFKGPIKANIEVFIQVPKSDSKKLKEAKLSGKIRPQIKPDVDNLCKTILDALNGLAYEDDKQVVECVIKKFYATEPCAYVVLKSLEVE